MGGQSAVRTVSGRTIRARFGSALLGAALATLTVAAGASAAAATVTPYSYSFTFDAVDALPECREGEGALTGTYTEYGSGRIVATAGGRTIVGTDWLAYRFELPGGGHVDGLASAHFVSVEQGPVVVLSYPIRETRTFVASDGESIGSLTIHALTHLTYDTRTDEFNAAFDRFRVTCR